MNNIVSIIKNIKLPSSVARVGLKAKKHAPEIMVISGAIIVVGSAIVACKNSVEAHDIIEKAGKELDGIEHSVKVSNPKDYTPKAARNDRMHVYSKTGMKLAKCYGPSIIGAGIGFGLIFGAQTVLKNRNAALTVAYSNLLTNFNQYRKRVADSIGEDKERLISMGAEKTDISYEDPETGKTKKVKNAIVVHDDGSSHSIYARLFDEYINFDENGEEKPHKNQNWSKNPSSNLVFIRSIQNWANEKLESEGILFLNDVYQALGFPRTSDGQIVGWVWDPNKEIEGHDGDNYVDFGIYDTLYTDRAKRDFINACTPCVWLDFNVDGPVYNLI